MQYIESLIMCTCCLGVLALFIALFSEIGLNKGNEIRRQSKFKKMRKTYGNHKR